MGRVDQVLKPFLSSKHLINYCDSSLEIVDVENQAVSLHRLPEYVFARIVLLMMIRLLFHKIARFSFSRILESGLAVILGYFDATIYWIIFGSKVVG